MITKEQHETINSFYDKIHRATMDGKEWVETSQEILDHYNKQGLGRSQYFHFQNIKVCLYGKSEELQKGLSRQHGNVVYGDSEAKVVVGTPAVKPHAS